MYRRADLVLMGGSLLPHGGQNPLEPAQLGLPIVVGPHMHNFSTMLTVLQEADAVETVTDASLLYSHVATLLNDAPLRERRGAHAQRAVQMHRGASTQIAASILAILDPKSLP